MDNGSLESFGFRLWPGSQEYIKEMHQYQRRKTMQVTMQGKYQTRDGRAVRILATDMKGPYSVAGVITEANGGEHIYSWQENGRADCCPENWNYNSDLIPVPTKHEGWIVVERIMGEGYRPAFVTIFDTKERAVHAMCEEFFTGKTKDRPEVSVALVTWES